MTTLESIWHYVVFTVTTMGFALIGFVLFLATVVFINGITAWIAAWLMISFGCWLADRELNFARNHYPHLCPPPRW